ncbi:MAG: YraN family protein [Pseudomonadota bacterium]
MREKSNRQRYTETSAAPIHGGFALSSAHLARDLSKGMRLATLTGKQYETLAARWLSENGLKIIARNFSCRRGEIDLIALDGNYLVFVEVRGRTNARFAGAAASIDRRKRLKVIRAAQSFLKQRSEHSHRPCRFDVVGFEPSQSPARSRIQWLRAAFTA